MKTQNTSKPSKYIEHSCLIITNEAGQVVANTKEVAETRRIIKAVNTQAVLLRELKSAIHYIAAYGGDVTTNFSSGGNLGAVLRIIEEAERS